MKDFLGNSLYVGDSVVFIRNHGTGAYLCRGTITGFTLMQVQILPNGETENRRVAAKKVIKCSHRAPGGVIIKGAVKPLPLGMGI